MRCVAFDSHLTQWIVWFRLVYTGNFQYFIDKPHWKMPFQLLVYIPSSGFQKFEMRQSVRCKRQAWNLRHWIIFALYLCIVSCWLRLPCPSECHRGSQYSTADLPLADRCHVDRQCTARPDDCSILRVGSVLHNKNNKCVIPSVDSQRPIYVIPESRKWIIANRSL